MPTGSFPEVWRQQLWDKYILSKGDCREFKDMVFEDVVFDNNRNIYTYS